VPRRSATNRCSCRSGGTTCSFTTEIGTGSQSIRDTHASEAEYRYEATEVAPDVETFADHVRERYLFVLAGLSDAEREVVEESIDGAYFEDDDAFRSVIDRIRAHDGIRVDDFYGTWLLEYEGAEYLAYVEW